MHLEVYDNREHSHIRGRGDVGENEVTAGGYPPSKLKDTSRSTILPPVYLRARVIESTKYKLPMIVILTGYHNIPFSSCEHTWSLREALTLFRGVHMKCTPATRRAATNAARGFSVRRSRYSAVCAVQAIRHRGLLGRARKWRRRRERSGGVGRVPPTKTPQSSTTPPHSTVPAAEQGVGQAPHVVRHETLLVNVSWGCAAAASTVFFFLTSNMSEALTNSQALKCLSSQPLTYPTATL